MAKKKGWTVADLQRISSNKSIKIIGADDLLSPAVPVLNEKGKARANRLKDLSQRDVEYDSKEEKYFAMWLEELKIAGYVEEYKKAETYVLSEKVERDYIKKMIRVPDKNLKTTILSKRVYTPDFEIKWTKKSVGVFTEDIDSGVKFKESTIISKNLVSIIEVKADYDAHNMTRAVRHKIAWTYEKYGVYVKVCKIPSWFSLTFAPLYYASTEKNMPFKITTLKEYLSC